MHFQKVILQLIVHTFAFSQICTGEDAVNESSRGNALLVWQQMFRLKRSQQLGAVKNLLENDDHQNRQKMVKLLIEALRKVIVDSRDKLQKLNFEPGMQFPEDTETKEALSRILENTAFFADLALHLPDYATKLYKKDHELQNDIKWSIEFCNKTAFFDEATMELMYLISQELNLVERQENYVNPYRESFQRERDAMLAESKKNLKPKEKKINKKGPKMSSSRKTEL